MKKQAESHVRLCLDEVQPNLWYVVLLLFTHLSRVQLFCYPMDYRPPGSSLSMGFLSPEYWSWLSFPSPGDLPDPGIEPMTPALLRQQETWVPSLGWEGFLEEGTAAHSSVLAWRIPWTEEAAGL